MIRTILALAVLTALQQSSPAHASVCPAIPLPAPIAGTALICHPSYASFYDDNLKVPRLVAYQLTGPHTLGCLPREPGFHVDETHPTASPSNYLHTGYDLGHFFDAEDGAWDKSVEYDTFSTANIAPQLPGLNRQGWEQGENVVRAWAYQHGDVIVYIGPIMAGEQTIGKDRIAVPAGFFKLVVDPATREAIAFEMPQKAIPKGDIAPFQVTIQDVEDQTGIDFVLPDGVDVTAKPPFWPADLKAWSMKRREACSH